MNDYYVSPWLLYGIELLKNLNSACLIMFIVSGAASVVFVALWNDAYSDERKAKWLGLMKRAMVVWSIMLMLCVVLPSEKAMYRMLIASYFTKENTQQALDSIDMATEKLINKIIRAREGKK